MALAVLRRPEVRHGRSANAAVYLALGSDLLVALVKFGTAAHTGSSAMMSEGVHSLVDACTGMLLVYGLKASRRPSTAEHQLGFGREIFFWNLMVAMTILAVGAGVALVDGIRQYRSPRPLDDAEIGYVVLAFAFVAEAVSFLVAARDAGLLAVRKRWRSYIRNSRNATSLTILFGSATGMLGVIVTACGTVVANELHQPRYDGAASIIIALILAATALFLARNSKDLLIGVPASRTTIRSVLGIAQANALVRRANGTISVHLAPDQIMVALSIEFEPRGTTASIEAAVVEIERAIRLAHPEIVLCLVKPQSAEAFSAISTGRGW